MLTTPGSSAAAGIAAAAGWEIANSPITTPDAASTFDKTIPGIDAAGNPTLNFYDDDASATNRTALAKGTAGFVIRMPYGDVATKRCEVWPVRSTGVNDDSDLVANSAATFTVGFAVEDTPEQNAVIPAA